MPVSAAKPALRWGAPSPSGIRVVSASDDIFDFTINPAGTVTVKRVSIDLTSDADFNTAAVVTAYLKNGATTITSTTVTVTDASHASINFFPATSLSAAATWDVVLDTATLLDEDAADDPLVASITYGSYASIVTPGGFWWSDGYTTPIKWLGYITTGTTTLMSDVINY